MDRQWAWTVYFPSKKAEKHGLTSGFNHIPYLAASSTHIMHHYQMENASVCTRRRDVILSQPHLTNRQISFPAIPKVTSYVSGKVTPMLAGYPSI